MVNDRGGELPEVVLQYEAVDMVEGGERFGIQVVGHLHEGEPHIRLRPRHYVGVGGRQYRHCLPGVVHAVGVVEYVIYVSYIGEHRDHRHLVSRLSRLPVSLVE